MPGTTRNARGDPPLAIDRGPSGAEDIGRPILGLTRIGRCRRRDSRGDLQYQGRPAMPGATCNTRGRPAMPGAACNTRASRWVSTTVPSGLKTSVASFWGSCESADVAAAILGTTRNSRGHPPLAIDRGPSGANRGRHYCEQSLAQFREENRLLEVSPSFKFIWRQRARYRRLTR